MSDLPEGFRMVCDEHRDREGILTVDLPSIGVKRFMCLECQLAFSLRMPTRAPRRREDGPYDYGNDKDITGRDLWGPNSREADHARHMTAMKERKRDE